MIEKKNKRCSYSVFLEWHKHTPSIRGGKEEYLKEGERNWFVHEMNETIQNKGRLSFFSISEIFIKSFIHLSSIFLILHVLCVYLMYGWLLMLLANKFFTIFNINSNNFLPLTLCMFTPPNFSLSLPFIFCVSHNLKVHSFVTSIREGRCWVMHR